jgi:hypothetical protein
VDVNATTAAIADALNTKADQTQVDTLLESKASSANVYTKAESNAIESSLVSALNNRAVKTEVSTSLALKANSADVYTKNEINNNETAFATALNNRAYKTKVYTTSEVNTSLALKQNIITARSPLEKVVNVLSGQVEIKLSEAYMSGNLNTSNVYIKSEMDTFISNIATEVNNITPKTDVSLLGQFRMVSGLDVSVLKIP